MAENDSGVQGLRIVQARVYYDADTGEIAHVHTLGVAPGDSLDEARIEEEMEIFEDTLKERHDKPLQHIRVDESDLRDAIGPDVGLRVDVTTHQLVRETQ